MGMSNPDTGTTSPFEMYYTVNKSDGFFNLKSKGIKGKENVGKKLQFVVIDDYLITIKGYNPTKGSIRSNVLSHGRGDFKVINGKTGTVLGHGKWKDIKENLPSHARYTKLVFIYVPKHDQYAMLQLDGTALYGYSQSLEDHNLRSGEGRLFNVKDFYIPSKDYYSPKFESRPLKDTEKEKALKEKLIAWDSEILQPYISHLTGSEARVEPEQAAEEGSQTEEEDEDLGDDLPF